MFLSYRNPLVLPNKKFVENILLEVMVEALFMRRIIRIKLPSFVFFEYGTSDVGQ